MFEIMQLKKVSNVSIKPKLFQHDDDDPLIQTPVINQRNVDSWHHTIPS